MDFRNLYYYVPGFDQGPPAALVKARIRWAGGGEIRISFTEGDVSIAAPDDWRRGDEVQVKLESRAAVVAARNKLFRAVVRGSGGLIEVRRAGAGSSSKSCKIRVRAWANLDQWSEDQEERKHTITVPISVLVTQGSETFVPRWVLVNTLKKRLYDPPGGYSFAGAIWPLASSVDDIFAPLVTAAEKYEIEKAERQRIAAAQREIRNAEREAGRARAAAQAEERRKVDEARSSKEQKKKEDAHKRRVDQSTAVASVEWDEWKKNGSRMEKITHTAANCRLTFSGQRVYIILENGKEIIKTQQTVRWS